MCRVLLATLTTPDPTSLVTAENFNCQPQKEYERYVVRVPIQMCHVDCSHL